MAEKKQVVSLDLSMLTSKVDEIKAIDEKLAAARGTQAEWMKKGVEAARTTLVRPLLLDEVDSFDVTFVIDEKTTVGDHLDEVRSYLEDCEQFGNELCTAWIKANRKDSDESTALRTRREALFIEAAAVQNVLVQMGMSGAADVEIPKAVKGGGGATARVKTSGMTFYRVVDGEKVRPGPTQDSLSSMAWYQFGHAGVVALREALKAQHGHVDETAPWEGEVTCNEKTWTIGWEKIETPAADNKGDEGGDDK